MLEDATKILSAHWVSMLRSGVIPWLDLWRSGQPANLLTGEPYTGINALILGISPFKSPYWISESQCEFKRVRLPSKSPAFLTIHRRVLEEIIPRHKPWDPPLHRVLPSFGVIKTFNFDTIRGIPDPGPPAARLAPKNPVEFCEKIIRYMPRPPRLKHDRRCKHARYVLSKDVVLTPPPGLYKQAGVYYATLFHELIHSTGHQSRLGRQSIEEISSINEKRYTLEELVAEIGGAALCWIGGIPVLAPDAPEQARVQWLDCLTKNPQLVLAGLGQAAAAVHYVTGALGFHLAREAA